MSEHVIFHLSHSRTLPRSCQPCFFKPWIRLKKEFGSTHLEILHRFAPLSFAPFVAFFFFPFNLLSLVWIASAGISRLSFHHKYKRGFNSIEATATRRHHGYRGLFIPKNLTIFLHFTARIPPSSEPQHQIFSFCIQIRSC